MALGGWGRVLISDSVDIRHFFESYSLVRDLISSLIFFEIWFFNTLFHAPEKIMFFETFFGKSSRNNLILFQSKKF